MYGEYLCTMLALSYLLNTQVKLGHLCSSHEGGLRCRWAAIRLRSGSCFV